METFPKIPDGYARLVDIASLAEVDMRTVRKRLKTAGVTTKLIRIVGKTGRICIVPQREALYAVLEK